MPILYVVQELTVRLRLTTRKGHGELIAERFGKGWAWLSVEQYRGLGVRIVNVYFPEIALRTETAKKILARKLDSVEIEV